MKRHFLRLSLRLALALLFFAGLNLCFAERSTPSFSVQTLDGQTLSNSSFSGNIVLLEFWATWCPVCKSDERAVDSIAAEYSSQGVSVVAIDVGESPETVKQYLQANPRSVDIALDPQHSAMQQFGGGGFPHYVVIGRSGNIVATRTGGMGEAGLRYLLNHALPPKASVQTAEGNSPKSSGGKGPQLINVPGTQSYSPTKAVPKTIFILASGEKLESDQYVIRGGYVDVTVAGQEHHIPLNSLDTPKTLAVNHQRGVDLKIPTNKSEVFIGF